MLDLHTYIRIHYRPQFMIRRLALTLISNEWCFLLLAFKRTEDWNFCHIATLDVSEEHCNITFLNTYCLFSGLLEHNNRMLEEVEHFKLSIMFSFSSIWLLYSNGPLNKQKVLSNVMNLSLKAWYAIQLLKWRHFMVIKVRDDPKRPCDSGEVPIFEWWLVACFPPWNLLFTWWKKK